jgi:hypothetical protein
MNDATPKSEIRISTSKNKKERVKKLRDLDCTYLEKTLLLFNQLNTSGIHAHKVEENRILGLKNEDITWALHVINPIYAEINTRIPNEKYMEVYEEVKERGGKKKIKIILYGDVVNNPVFFLSGFDDKPERTFMVGPQFDLALEEIKEVLDIENRYLILDQDMFFYERNKLEIKPGILYNSIRCVYDYFGGKNGDIKLSNLYKELRQIKGFSRKTEGQLNLIVRQNLTSRAMGFGSKIGKDAFDKHKVFRTKNGELFFSNEKVSE